MLSIKALRLYDRLGLLQPAAVNQYNGYRRYHEDQLFAARLIAMLRRLDMPRRRWPRLCLPPDPVPPR